MKKLLLTFSLFLNVYLFTGICVNKHLSALVQVAHLAPKEPAEYDGVVYKNVETIKLVGLSELYRVVWFNF